MLFGKGSARGCFQVFLEFICFLAIIKSKIIPQHTRFVFIGMDGLPCIMFLQPFFQIDCRTNIKFFRIKFALKDIHIFHGKNYKVRLRSLQELRRDIRFANKFRFRLQAISPKPWRRRMAGVPGFEPGIAIPKTAALPLGHTPTL